MHCSLKKFLGPKTFNLKLSVYGSHFLRHEIFFWYDSHVFSCHVNTGQSGCIFFNICGLWFTCVSCHPDLVLYVVFSFVVYMQLKLLVFISHQSQRSLACLVQPENSSACDIVLHMYMIFVCYFYQSWALPNMSEIAVKIINCDHKVSSPNHI